MQSRSLASHKAFFSLLPPGCALTSLEFYAEIEGGPDISQSTVHAVVDYCPPKLTLLLLVVGDDGGQHDKPLDERKALDIAPLLALSKLTNLFIKLPRNIQLDRALLSRFPVVWPGLEKLTLANTACGTAQAPSIDHSDYLALIQALPRLKHLSLAFDARKLTGDEVSTAAPVYLEYLDFEHSPISSASRALKFVKANFSLTRAPTAHFCHKWQNPLFEKRWHRVYEAWST